MTLRLRRSTDLISKTKIAILTHTPLWKACLQREFAQQEISWALDIDQLMQEVANRNWSTVIVELVSESIVEDCQKVLLASRHIHQTRFFAVGNARLRDWLPLILTCGFAECCCNPGKLPKLVSQALIVDKHGFQENETIEEKVFKRLPWKPVP